MTFKSEKEELEYLRSITRCKYFTLNPKWVVKENQSTYLPCIKIQDHQDSCLCVNQNN